MKKTLFLLYLLFAVTHLFAKEIYVIVNPISGGMNKEGVVRLIQESYDATICYTQGEGDATRLAKQAIEEKATLVIAVGGDGTVNEIGQALIGSNTALAIIPTGSGNGLAKTLKIPKNPHKALALIQEGQIVAIDTLQINELSCLGVAGMGFDAEIGWRFSEYGHRGFSSYLAVISKTLPNYHPRTYELFIDGKKVVQTAFMISFANSQQFGNGALIAPQASLCDGLLDVVIVKPFPFYEAPGLTYDLFHGTINKSEYVSTMTAKEVSIPQANLLMQIDGEPICFENGALIKVKPASLKVVVP